MITIQDWVDRDCGIKGYPGTNRVFYPRKPRSCKNCHLATFTNGYMKLTGCEYFETKEINGIQVPVSKCYPVIDDSNTAHLHAYQIRVKLENIKANNSTDNEYILI